MMDEWSTSSFFVRHFAPSWMVITMGTGSLAVTLSIFPFPFPGQQGIALAVWCLNVALFLLFLGLLGSRAACYPGSLRELLEVPNTSLFLGSLPMSISAITAGVLLVLVPKFGDGALWAAHVLIWANVPIIAVVALLIPAYMFSVHDHSMNAMTALWLVPVIPGTTAASVTGIASAVLPDDEAVLLLYLGMCMLAVGAALSSALLTMYLQRLICHSLPPREVIVSSFIPVGAVGMAGWALLNLARSADLHLRSHFMRLLGEAGDTAWLDAVLPVGLAASGVVSLALWAISGWWLILAVSSVGQTLRQGIPFTLGSWGSVFPLGTFAGLTITLGAFFRADLFRILGAAAACCQVAAWLFVTGMTLLKGLSGELFHPPCLARPAAGEEDCLRPPRASDVETLLSEAPAATLLTRMPESMPRALLRRMPSSLPSSMRHARPALSRASPGLVSPRQQQRAGTMHIRHGGPPPRLGTTRWSEGGGQEPGLVFGRSLSVEPHAIPEDGQDAVFFSLAPEGKDAHAAVSALPVMRLLSDETGSPAGRLGRLLAGENQV